MHMHTPYIHIHIHIHIHMYICICIHADMHSCTLHATRQVPVARYAMQPGWMTGVLWSPVGEALLAATDAPAIVLQLLQAPRTSHLAPRTSHVCCAPRTPHARCNAHPVRIRAYVRTPCTHACMHSPTRARAQQGTRVGSTSNLAMAGSSTSSGVWALSLSACGGLLAAVSSDGRLEVRCQEGKPGGQGTAASYRLVSRGLVQLHDAPRPEVAAAGVESSARAMRVLLGEAAEAPPPPAPDGQAPTPPHLALRVVAFNPNPAHRQWVACAGPSGLLACVRMPSSGKPSGKSKGRPPKGKTPKAGRGSGAWAAVDVCGIPVSDPD